MLPGFRFRKGIKLFPGVRLNISKSGISTSIGKSGATVNLSSRGTNATVGAPGTGLSYRKHLGGGKGYYGFLLIMLAFYVGYLMYTSLPKPQPIAAPAAAPTQSEQPVAQKPPVKHHRKRHKAQ